MAARRPGPRQSTDGQPPLLRAAELLSAGDYEQAVDCLHEAQQANERRGETVAALFLVLAQRICLACSQCQAEMRWHRQAYQEAEDRELTLRRELQRLLDLVGGQKTPTGPAEQKQLAALARTVLPPLEPVQRPSLWQRLRSVLGGRIGRQQVEGPVPGGPAEDSTPYPSESLEMPSSFLAGTIEEPAETSAKKIDTPTAPAAEEARVSDSPHPDIEEAPIDEAVPDERSPDTPSLVVHCLGPFRVFQDARPVEDWPSGKGKAIFKYIVTHRERPIPKEVLMELFWPGAQPDAARNNLNVAVYGLRQALRQARPSFSHVLFQDDCYMLNPDLQIWVDVEEFRKHCRVADDLETQGELSAAMHEYRTAESLYQGEFLEEDRYEDWPIPLRQSLQGSFLNALDRLSRYDLDREDYVSCTMVSRRMLAVDACCEEAHRRLMRCYSRQGQPYLALRQYHLCVEMLQKELDVHPMDETLALYQRLCNGEAI